MTDIYTKFWSSILDSAIWGEPDHVRLVWITLLAMKDGNGHVEASIDGIARRANLGFGLVEEALDYLQCAPDSVAEDDESQRIEKVGRSWKILGNDDLQDLLDREQKRAYERNKKRRQRSRLAGSGDA